MSGAAIIQYAGTIWALEPEWPLPAIVPLCPATFTRVGRGDEDRLAVAMGLPSPAEVRRRLDSGRRCYAAEVASELATYGWVTFDQEAVGEVGLRVQLPPGDAYIWDCATAPEYRRRHLYTALLVHIAGALRADGLHHIWIGAAPGNAASHAGIARAGFQPVADLFVAPTRAAGWFSMRERPGISAGLLTAARQFFRDDSA